MIDAPCVSVIEWIDASVALPSDDDAENGEYMIAATTTDGVRSVFGSVFFEPDHQRFQWGDAENDFVDIDGWIVTHWASMPEPP